MRTPGVKLADEGCTGVLNPIVSIHEPISQIDARKINARGSWSGGWCGLAVEDGMRRILGRTDRQFVASATLRP